MSIRQSLRTAVPFVFLAVLFLAGSAAAAPRLAEMTELWRVGGEDDEIFFGSVAAIRTGPDGNILILDGQLSEVQVYSPDGEYLRTLSREGDGPGEIRQPNDLFVTSDGTVCVLQGFPGKITKVGPDGLPAGEVKYTLGDGSPPPMGILNRGFALPEGMLLAGIRMVFAGAISQQTYHLTICTAEGTQKTSLVEKENPIDYSDFVMTEAGLDFVWSRVAVGPGGTIFTAPQRNAYEIEVFDASGSPLRTITRDYSQAKRPAAETQDARRVLEAIGAYYPRPPVRYVNEDTAPAIAGMWAADDGRLWVQTGDAHRYAPEGAWMVLDVFGPEGEFEEQVALPGSYQARQDALFVQPDGLVIVVVGALDAFLNQQAVSSQEGGGESTAQPLEVICYSLGR